MSVDKRFGRKNSWPSLSTSPALPLLDREEFRNLLENPLFGTGVRTGLLRNSSWDQYRCTNLLGEVGFMRSHSSFPPHLPCYPSGGWLTPLPLSFFHFYSGVFPPSYVFFIPLPPYLRRNLLWFSNLIGSRTFPEHESLPTLPPIYSRNHLFSRLFTDCLTLGYGTDVSSRNVHNSLPTCTALHS